MPPSFTYLKCLEIDDNSDSIDQQNFDQQNIKLLASRGLLTVFYEDPNGKNLWILPLRVQEKALLRKHVSNGLIVWGYQTRTGEWGPNYDLLEDDEGDLST
jgi:hypothetical protein